LAALAVVAGKGARDGAGNGYGEKSQGLSCALWFVLQKSRELVAASVLFVFFFCQGRGQPPREEPV